MVTKRKFYIWNTDKSQQVCTDSYIHLWENNLPDCEIIKIEKKLIPALAEYIPVVFVTDDKYVLPTAVAINSMIKNKKKTTKYHIIILHSSVSRENVEIFEKFNGPDIKIDMFVPSNAEFLLSIKEHQDYVTPAVLMKFAIPAELNNYKKVLYIDGDTLIMGDLTELYNTDIDEYYAGVVKDVHPIITQHPQKIGTKNYFNAGVMLFNIEKIMDDGIYFKLNSSAILNKTKEYLYFEQDTYNIIFNDKVKYLHPKYNYIADSWQEYGSEKCSEIFDMPKREGKSLLKNSVIYHLACPKKPWVYKDILMRKIWEKYYKRSPVAFMPIGEKISKIDCKKNKSKLFYVEEQNKRRIVHIWGIRIKYRIK